MSVARVRRYLLAVIIMASFPLARGSAEAKEQPIQLEQLENRLRFLTSVPKGDFLTETAKFLGGLGLEIRLRKGDTVPLPLRTAAQFRDDEVLLISRDGSRQVLASAQVALLTEEGKWLLGSTGGDIKVRASVVASKQFLFVTDLEMGLMSRVERP